MVTDIYAALWWQMRSRMARAQRACWEGTEDSVRVECNGHTKGGGEGVVVPQPLKNGFFVNL